MSLVSASDGSATEGAAARRGSGSAVRRDVTVTGPSAGALDGVFPRLSRREEEVLAALGERLTNAEIGSRLFLSIRTVETYVSGLLRKFDAVNRRELAVVAQQHLRTAPRRIGRPLPPQLAALIGRDADLDAVIERLHACRLLTLVGPAGVGKTRLAVEVAARVEQSFEGGALFVDLTPASDEATLLAAVVGALNPANQAPNGSREALLGLLAVSSPVLLVFDNCEHVLGPVSELLVDALGTNESLRVLATSREWLTIPGEHAFAVAPLDAPSAAQLFRTRAAAVDARFGTDDSGSADAIGSICRRLDGLPLAIELAAAQVVAFTPEQIDARLTGRFSLLQAPTRGRVPRHAALETALGWSYDLLDAGERILLDRLAVFRGRFSVEAVEAVATDVVVDPGAVGKLLVRLVRKSLVVADTAGNERRYRLLETIREYGLARLDATHELGRWRQRHLDWVLDLMAHAVDGADSGEQAERFATLDEELPNIETALEWSLRAPDDAVRALTAVQGVRSYWLAGGIRRGHGLRWLHATIAAAASVSAATRARALLDAVMMCILDDLPSASTLSDAVRALAGDDPLARAYAALASAFVGVHGGGEAQRAAREAVVMIPVDDQLHWWARYMLALDVGRRGHLAEAADQLREVVEAFHRFGDEHLADGTLAYIADFALGMGEVEAARADAQRSLAMARHFECASCESQALIELALIDHPDAPEERLAQGRRALGLAHTIGETWNVLAALDLIAAALADSGRVDQAVTIGVAGQTVRAHTGVAQVLPTRGAEVERALVTARARLDPASFADLARDGAALDLESAVALALG